VVELVDIRALRELYGVYSRRLGRMYGFAARPDFIAAIAAMLGVLVFDTLPGLFIGIATSLMLLLYRASTPHVAVLGQVPGAPDQFGDVERHPENTLDPHVIVLRVESPLFFANAESVRTRVRRATGRAGTWAIILDVATVPSIDISAAHMLESLAQELARMDVELVLAGDVGQVRDVLRTAGEGSVLGAHTSVRTALDSLRACGHPSSPSPRPEMSVGDGKAHC
jgi:sulfate permease, SulP family